MPIFTSFIRLVLDSLRRTSLAALQSGLEAPHSGNKRIIQLHLEVIQHALKSFPVASTTISSPLNLMTMSLSTLTFGQMSGVASSEETSSPCVPNWVGKW